MIRILDTGAGSAEANMARDAALLEEMAQSGAAVTLHLYRWDRPCATYGYFLDPWTLLTEDAKELELARRPTGGGIVFHLTDWAFSLLIPATHPAYSMNTLENYVTVNKKVVELIWRFAGGSLKPTLMACEASSCHRQEPSRFCMALPTRYDIMVDGRKVGGAAQRRTRYGLLHQGTISLVPPDEEVMRRMLLESSLADAMVSTTYPLLSGRPTVKEVEGARETLSRLAQDVFATI